MISRETSGSQIGQLFEMKSIILKHRDQFDSLSDDVIEQDMYNRCNEIAELIEENWAILSCYEASSPAERLEKLLFIYNSRKDELQTQLHKMIKVGDICPLCYTTIEKLSDHGSWCKR